MIFRQLVEPISSTYTYLIGCEETGQAVLIDPVINSIERDLCEIRKLGLKLAYTLDTHIHADHITSARELKERVGSLVAAPAMDELPCTDFGIEEAKPLRVGSLIFDPIHTPGHTAGHFACKRDRVFTGDALLIEGCGRTDFQGGDAAALYHSVTQKLFSLPDDYLVYPAHDYQNRRVSTIAQEKLRNPRLGQGKNLEEFKHIMDNLDLSYPSFIDYAVPGNQRNGVCPDELPADLQHYCGPARPNFQG